MKKKFAIIMMALMCSMSAWAIDYYLGWMTINATKSSGGDEQVEQEDVLTSVEKNADGTYKVTLYDFVLLRDGKLYDIGTLEYDNLTAKKQNNGYWKVEGTRQMRVSDIEGYQDMIPSQYQHLLSDAGNTPFEVKFTGRFNGSKFFVTIDTDIVIKVSSSGAVMTVFQTHMDIDYTGDKTDAPQPPLMEGDVNGDDKVDISDVNCAINIILEANVASDFQGSADLTGDGKVDISDVNAIINIILAN
ncbi:MAG: hypothetical protein J5565_01075 [Muribaculaceae bacterium]|nr:hypothetical protein [Muribaculaceae bacterium]